MGWLSGILGRSRASKQAAPVPPDAAKWRALGNEALGRGDNAEAQRSYAQGVQADPSDPLLRLNLGFVLLEQGEAREAAERLMQALALRRPGDDFAADAHFLLGRAQAQLGDAVQALASFDAALAAKDDFFEALEEGTRVLHVLQRHREAAQWARKMADLRPSAFAELLVATQLSLAGDFGQACELAGRVCAAEPANAEAAVVRFDALVKLGRRDEALAEAERALAAVGRTPRALVNAGVALFKLVRLDEALARIDEALALEPDRRDALINRVAILIEQLRVREAAEAARAALVIHPDDADLHWHLCIAAMLLGDFDTGWRESEWRTRSSAFRGKVPQFERPHWTGESLQGKAIFVQGEQGYGDCIQFIRFVPEVAARADKVWVQVPQALEPLVEGALPPNCEQLPQGSRLPPVDYVASLLSLPAILRTTEQTIPAQVPDLRADAARVQQWRQRLPRGTLNVGITWCGNARHVNDHNRSMSLETIRRAAVPHARFVTLQPELPEFDRAALARWDQALDLGRELEDFADTAALVEALDLVISVDTSVAHLAGALGKPVWILLPHAPDWRWMLGREDSPWYPTARLFRQPSAKAWDPVVDRVRAELAKMSPA